MTAPLSAVTPRRGRLRPGLALAALWRAFASPEAAWLFKGRAASHTPGPVAPYPVCGGDIVAAPFAPGTVADAARQPPGAGARVRRSDSSGLTASRAGKAS